MYWDQLKSPDFDALNKNLPVILPVAATEQHGDHLPIATDRMIVDHFCREIESRMSDGQLILPTLQVGCSEHHMAFPGSLTLTHEAFAGYCFQLIQSAYRHGFNRFLIFNSHGGNTAVGRVATETLGQQFADAHIVFLSWFSFAAEKLRALQESGAGGIGHAGEFETSLMLTIRPDLVDMQAVDNINIAQMPTWATGDLLRGPAASYYRSFRQRTFNGVLGDPRSASAAKGEQITDVVVSEIILLLQDLASI